MFAWFKNKLKESSYSDVSPASQPEIPFTTQKHMLRHHGDKEPGRCNQLANAFIAASIAQEDTQSLVNDESLFYQRAMEQAKIQETMIAENSANPRYSAFEASKTAYTVTNMPRSEVTSPDKINSLCGNSRYALFSLPTKKKAYHMVGFVNKGNGTCQFFDADFPGGVVEDRCKTIQTFMAKMIAHTFPENETNEAVIAKSIP